MPAPVHQRSARLPSAKSCCKGKRAPEASPRDRSGSVRATLALRSSGDTEHKNNARDLRTREGTFEDKVACQPCDTHSL